MSDLSDVDTTVLVVGVGDVVSVGVGDVVSVGVEDVVSVGVAVGVGELVGAGFADFPFEGFVLPACAGALRVDTAATVTRRTLARR